MTNEWIEWNGGECPVAEGTLVDVKYRCGEINDHVKALICFSSGGSINNKSAFDWAHGGYDTDIIAYRLHNRAFQVGDKVTCLLHGKGEVVKTNDSLRYPIRVMFANKEEGFTIDGKWKETFPVNLYHGHGTFKVEFITDPEPQFEYQWEYWYKHEGKNMLIVSSCFYTSEKHALSCLSSPENFNFKRREDTKREVK